MSDNYEFMKTSESQDATDYSPYVDKQYNNYINDINNGVYTNNSLTLVNFFQLSQSQSWTNLQFSEIYREQRAFRSTTDCSSIWIFERFFSSGTITIISSDMYYQKRLFKPYTSGGRRRKWPLYRTMPTIYKHCSTLSINIRNV